MTTLGALVPARAGAHSARRPPQRPPPAAAAGPEQPRRRRCGAAKPQSAARRTLSPRAGSWPAAQAPHPCWTPLRPRRPAACRPAPNARTRACSSPQQPVCATRGVAPATPPCAAAGVKTGGSAAVVTSSPFVRCPHTRYAVLGLVMLVAVPRGSNSLCWPTGERWRSQAPGKQPSDLHTVNSTVCWCTSKARAQRLASSPLASRLRASKGRPPSPSQVLQVPLAPSTALFLGLPSLTYSL